MADKRDYYDVLGLRKGAAKDEIKKAYRKLALQYHPDRNPGPDGEAKFKEASEAADVLLNDEKRTRYDQFGHAGVDGQAGGGFGGFGGFGGGGEFSDLGDIFGDIFGDFLGGNRKRRRGSRVRAGNDLQTSITVDFKEAAFGAEKTISISRSSACESCHGSGGEKGSQPTTCDQCHGYGEIRRQQGFFTVSSPCPKCQGSGQMVSNPCKTCHGKGTQNKTCNLSVKIPPGIDVGQRLKLTGEGDAGTNGGPSGDLYVVVDIAEHEFFERDEYDIHCIVPINFSQAALGDEIEVPTLEGKVKLTVPAGTQSGRKFRLKGKGISRLGSYGIGDQIVTMHVETPTKLSSEAKDLFKQLRELESGASYPMSKGFFEKVKELFH